MDPHALILDLIESPRRDPRRRSSTSDSSRYVLGLATGWCERRHDGQRLPERSRRRLPDLAALVARCTYDLRACRLIPDHRGVRELAGAP